MKLEKGKVYRISTDALDYYHAHDRAEYHSTFARESDGEPLHNFIIRFNTGDLEMTLFLSDDITGLSDSQEI